jgi:hypothetical protein
MLAVVAAPRDLATTYECGYIVPEASHPGVAASACSGRVLVAEHQVTSIHNYSVGVTVKHTTFKSHAESYGLDHDLDH